MSSELLQYQNIELDLASIVQSVQRLLEGSRVRPADARVAALPDVRTLRYYQTSGLLDKPRRYDGRKAVYGYRHLLQVLGIKLLQVQGYSLTQIQQALSDLDTVALEREVMEWLRMRQSLPGVLLPAFSGAARQQVHDEANLIAMEIGEGISVVLDPRRVEAPEVILAAMRELLNAIQEEI